MTIKKSILRGGDQAPSCISSHHWTVAKIGGSLFDLPDLSERLIPQLPKRNRCLLIAGGGPFADQVRRMEKPLGVSAAGAHQMAIRCMSVSALLLADLLPDFTLFAPSEWEDLLSCHCRTRLVLDPWQLLETESGKRLPVGWQVTSDSIAAFIARKLGAGSLTLFKSVGATTELSPTDLENSDWVDEFFSTAARGLSIRWVNLRSGFAEEIVQSHES